MGRLRPSQTNTASAFRDAQFLAFHKKFYSQRCMQPGDASHRVHRFSHAEGSGWVSGCCANATRPRDELHFRPLRRSVSISSIAHELRACQGGRDSAGGTSRSDYWHSLAAACLVSLTLESELDEPKDAGANQYDSKDSRPKVPPPIYRAIVRGY